MTLIGCSSPKSKVWGPLLKRKRERARLDGWHAGSELGAGGLDGWRGSEVGASGLDGWGMQQQGWMGGMRPAWLGGTRLQARSPRLKAGQDGWHCGSELGACWRCTAGSPWAVCSSDVSSLGALSVQD